MSWLYDDSRCDCNGAYECDRCEGARTVARDIPEDALFDGDYEHRGRGPRQNRWRE